MTWGTRICPTGGASAAGGMPLTAAVTAVSAVPPTSRNVSFGVSNLGVALRSVDAIIAAIGKGGVPIQLLGVREAVLSAETIY